MGLAWSEAGVTSNAENFPGDQLEPGERIEAVAFGKHVRLRLDLSVLEGLHRLPHRPPAVRLALPLPDRCSDRARVGEPHEKVELEHFGKAINSALNLRPRKDRR
jgi:hypothetical protein